MAWSFSKILRRRLYMPSNRTAMYWLGNRCTKECVQKEIVFWHYCMRTKNKRNSSKKSNVYHIATFVSYMIMCSKQHDSRLDQDFRQCMNPKFTNFISIAWTYIQIDVWWWYLFRGSQSNRSSNFRTDMFTCQLGNEDSRQINIRLAHEHWCSSSPTIRPVIRSYKSHVPSFFFLWLN